MRLFIRLVLAARVACGAGLPELPYFGVLGGDAGAWPAILGSVGFEQRPPETTRILVARVGAPADPQVGARVEGGAWLILEGESPLGEMLGIHGGSQVTHVASIMDVHDPKLRIVWEQAADVQTFELPAGARVFARERWNGTPVLAGWRRGAGAILWMATAPGTRGYERYPYLVAALCDLGLDLPFRGARLWAFFDSAYRTRVDLDYFAARWRKAGIAALQVAAWHFYDKGAEQDAYLERLIAACHRHGILVYAWLELPHVSEKFWDDHPEWREKTAVLQDAQLDWRKLMNLEDPQCFQAVATGVDRLIKSFDWDGVNLAELYFESLEGIENPSRFTPMNDTVRAMFKQGHGFDPIELFGVRRDEASRRLFLDFRSELARQLQGAWIARIEAIRRERPDLDLVLTHVDDRFDAGMRDAIGADAAHVLPLLDKHRFTFLIEDPATVWNLGPARYGSIAERYRTLTPHEESLAIDINIVERYQDVYPTKQQTGAELLELVHSAAQNFPRVALYFENSLLTPDLPLLPAASAAVTRFEKAGEGVMVASPHGFGLPWHGPALVDGKPWPIRDGETLWLPAGEHQVEAAKEGPALGVLALNAELEDAAVLPTGAVRFTYHSAARAIALTEKAPRSIQIDEGRPMAAAGDGMAILLPSGHHVVTLSFD